MKTWGHAGGQGGKLIMKCDNEASIRQIRDAVAKLLGGEVVPDDPAKGES